MKIDMHMQVIKPFDYGMQDGRVVYVAQVLVVIQYNVLVVTSGYTRSVVV